MDVDFRPKEKSDEFVSAVDEYEQIWQSDGKEITKVMQEITGLRFQEDVVEAVVYEGPSSSGRSIDKPMKLRASYPHQIKKATVIHELGHRILFGVDPQEHGCDDSHEILFLFLYDVWAEIYDSDFADRAVEVESARTGLHDYKSMWQEVLELNKDERISRFNSIISS